MEEWKTIKNTNGDYQVSNLGRIRSKRNKNREWKIINCFKEKTGYIGVKIRFNNTNKRTHLLVHRLVAEYFLIKTSKNMEVNHINGVKTDNRVENLEWVTSSENTEHAVKNKLLVPWNKPRKPIIAINLETNETKEFDSISKAELFFNSRHITDVLKGKRTQTRGYTFRYIERR